MGSPLKNNFFISELDTSDIAVHELYLSDIALCDVPLLAFCVCVRLNTKLISLQTAPHGNYGVAYSTLGNVYCMSA